MTEAFYWDLNDDTRAWSKRFAAVAGGRMPTADHAGVYPATLAYLRAVRDADTTDGVAVVRAMEARPITDPLFGAVTIRANGRAVHDMYRFLVKTPGESKGAAHVYTLRSVINGEDALRPVAESGCGFAQPHP